MTGFSRRMPDSPVTRQARRGKLGFFVAGLAAVLLIFWWLGPPADARDSAACEQYGCAEESPIRKASPAPGTYVSDTASASASASAPAEASAPAMASPAPVSSSPPLETESPAPIEEGLAVEGDDPSETADGEEPSHDPMASDDALDGDDFSTDLTTEEEPTTEEEAPLAAYPYAGKPCEESDCGLEAVEEPLQCATYETTSGKEVYGCADPGTFEREGCYEITFYTTAGKPYANLDTCSGEKPYDPPEPPEGWFRYWEPPDTPREPAHGSWMPHWDQCQKRSGAVNYHCGLKGIPQNWECKIFYNTVHGTVRGCYSPRERTKPEATRRGFFCADKLRLYDEAGRRLGTYRQCPKIRTEYCGKDRCGEHGVPDQWWCRTEEWRYGDIYDGERRTFTRCADPHIEDYWSGKMQPTNENARCGVLLDERGKRVDEVLCGDPGQGDGVVGLWAGEEAEEADETLNGSGESSGETGGQAPPAGEAGGPLGALVVAFSELVGGDGGTATDPEVAGPASPTSGVESGTASVEDPGAEPLPPPASSSAASGDSPAEGDDGSAGEASRSVSPDAREAGPTGGMLAADAVASSIKPPTEDNGVDAHDGSSRRDRVSAEEEGSNLGSTWTAGFALPSPLAEAAAPSIAKGMAGGWLGVAVPLAGLGAVGGVFALRRRFFG